MDARLMAGQSERHSSGEEEGFDKSSAEDTVQAGMSEWRHLFLLRHQKKVLRSLLSL